MPTPQMLGRSFDIIEGFVTVDLQTAANAGDFVDMKNNDRIAIVFTSGVGTDNDDPTITIEQAINAAGDSNKALDFTVIHVKQAATSLAAVTAWTRVAQAASNTFTRTDSAQQSLIWVIEFAAEDLDVDGGFDFIQAAVNNIGGNTQPGSLQYLVQPHHTNSPANVLSSLG